MSLNHKSSMTNTKTFERTDQPVAKHLKVDQLDRFFELEFCTFL